MSRRLEAVSESENPSGQYVTLLPRPIPICRPSSKFFLSVRLSVCLFLCLSSPVVSCKSAIKCRQTASATAVCGCARARCSLGRINPTRAKSVVRKHTSSRPVTRWSPARRGLIPRRGRRGPRWKAARRDGQTDTGEGVFADPTTSAHVSSRRSRLTHHVGYCRTGIAINEHVT